MADWTDEIFRIVPSQTPIFPRYGFASRRLLVKQFGQSGRARRRRLAKPVRFTVPSALMHEWVNEPLVPFDI